MFASPAGSPPSQPRRSSQPQSEPAQPERPRQSNANEGGEIEGAATCVSCVSLANKPKLLASRPATFWFSTLLKTNLNHPEPALVFHPLENQLEPSRASAGFPPSRKPTWTIPSQRWFSTLLETNLNSSGKKEPMGPVGFSIPYRTLVP
jgi:hypothetical protein